MNIDLFLALLLLQAADIATTYYFKSRNIAPEGNRIMDKLMQEMGLIPGLIIPKVLVMVPAYMSATTPIGIPWVDAVQTAILAALVGWYVWGVRKNMRVIQRARRG